MTDTRVKLSTIVQNQLPEYVRSDYPLVSEFLKQYYLSQEYQGAPVDLVNNINRYIDIDNSSDLNETVILKNTVLSDQNTIEIDSSLSPLGTHGFPDSYGLLKINDEIITYTGKTDYSFTGCIRGFSGITSLENDYKFEEVNFKTTLADIHSKGSEIQNLSILFLKEFLLKTKKQIVPGFEDRDFVDGISENNLVKNFKDFYASKGTERSFEIIFRALYGEDVKVIRPSDYILKPSDSNYLAVKGIIVESISGDPSRLKNLTLYQDYPSKSYAPIAYVESVGVGKSYYRLDIDSGYDRDARVKGTIYGNFKSTPKTRVLEQVSVGSSVLDVESTVGFAQTGNLYITYDNGSTGTISYDSKNLTQFLGCDFISGQINSASEVIDSNSYAYAENGDETIVVAITNVLSDFDILVDNRYYQSGDVARIKSLGIYDDDFKSSTWIYNNKSTYTIKSISKLDTSDNSYFIQLNNRQYLNLLDKLEVVSTTGSTISADILELTSDTSLNILTSTELDINAIYKLRRVLKKGKSQDLKFSTIENSPVNVQSVYKDIESNSRLFASSSIPSRNITIPDYKINLSGTFAAGEAIEVSKHGFYTGDKIYYETEKISKFSYNESYEYVETIEEGTKLFDEGEYYVYRIDENNLKVANSIQDIYYSLNNPTLSKFLRLSGITTVSNNYIQKKDFENKDLMHQKLFRRFDVPSNLPGVYHTKPGYTGMLVNGVEILNYKSKQKIYYGELNSVSVVNSDENFDIINPPNLIISDSSGIGATGNFSVKGSLKSISILDRGFDYEDVPIVSITGGNGFGARVQVSMKTIEHIEEFSAEGTNISAGSSIIGFSTYHKFRDNEQVKYITNGLSGIVGLTTNTNYFVRSENNTQVKLYKNLNDSVSRNNPIIFSANGLGNHYLKAINKKSTLNAINVLNGGENYENKLRTTYHTGINTSNSQIKILNHGYSSGEIIEYVGYGTTATQISGISTNTQYYVTKIDNDSFKLSQVGSGSTEKDFYYKNKKYVGITSTGNGLQFFNYPEIKVSVVGKVGLSSIGTETFEAKVQPIFRGSIETIDLYEKGIGYGSTNIIDFHRKPSILYSQGSGAELSVITYLGVITEVIVLRPGSGYISTPDLVIDGVGNGAVLTPVVENGEIKSVIVIEGGRNYNPFSTRVTVVPPQASSRTKFDCEVQKWTINLFEKEFDKFSSDDGILSTPVRSENGIQYSHLYAPRYLRSSLYSNDQDGRKLYGKRDLQFNKVEIDSSQHSPIIGWAYDGNPIYGPYGFSTKTGGSTTLMQSGYVNVSEILTNRPPKYPSGFFIEDYVHYNSNSDIVLDEKNGRFCVTPEFPNGTYAYFATINASSESDGVFKNYRKPKFPYLIGDNFYSKPIEFNFNRNSTQDAYDINNSNFIRITDYYNLFDKSESYPFISLPNNLNQTITVNSTQIGKIDNLVFENEAYGDNYAVNDIVTFENDGTGGSGAKALVSFIKGKTISSIENVKTTSNIEIYPSDKKGVYVGMATTSPHGFSNNELITITGISTSSTNIEGSYYISVAPKEFTLAGVGTTTTAIESNTDDVIYLRLSGLLKGSSIVENDILQIGEEEFKILNVEEESSRVRVRRSINGVSGLHTVGTATTIKQRKFEFTSGFNTDFYSYENRQIYFNPSESLGLGDDSSIGAGTKITFSNPGSGIKKIFVPTKSIYLKNHPFKTNDNITYSSNSNSLSHSIVGEYENGIKFYLSEVESFYAYRFNKDFVGLSTVKVGLNTSGIVVGIETAFSDSRLLYFDQVGVGVEHSLRTNYPIITGDAIRNKVTVSTGTSYHGLSPKHIVDFEVTPTTKKVIDVEYSDYYRNVLLNIKEFNQSDVSEENNTITIIDHEFENGQKIIYNTSIENPQQTLTDNDNELFYVIKIDGDRFKLSREQYDAISDNPTPVGLASTSGSFGAVNPRIFTNGNKTIEFNLNDSSLQFSPNGNNFYSAFTFKLYSDKNYSKIWETSRKNDEFNYVITGEIGKDAKATLNIDDVTPSVLYYKLEPIVEYSLLPPLSKREMYIDSSVNYSGEIHINKSKYSGRHSIQTEFDVATGIGSTSIFTFNLPEEPEKSSYTKDDALISYITDCTHTSGPIARFDIINGGIDYRSLPGISNIFSVFGTGAVIRAESNSIGKITSAKIDNFGYDFPHDKSLSPVIYYPQILKVEPFSSIESIGISSSGKGYLNNPRLIVVDGVTKKVNNSIELTYKLGDTNVEVLTNAYNLNNSTPRIVPVKGGSGIGVTFISFDQSSKEITMTLDANYESGDTLPFSVNDKILVEGSNNVSTASTLRGYNSSEYDYKLFTVKSVDPDYFGFAPKIVVDVSDLLDEDEVLGEFDSINSAVSVTAEKNFPIFDINLKMNEFIVGEKVKSKDSIGTVDGWDNNSSIVRISSTDVFNVGEDLSAFSSNSIGRITAILSSYKSQAYYDSSIEYDKGFADNVGFLNEISQRIQDSDYYQNFSYSLKSTVPFKTWNNDISSLNHPVGYRKFSDYQVESISNNIVGLSTSVITTLRMFVNNISMNDTYNFDIVNENAIGSGVDLSSTEIGFYSRNLSNYNEARFNRVLNVDDISSEFNSIPRTEEFINIRSFLVEDKKYHKLFALIKDRRFENEKQLSIVDIVNNEDEGFINQYAILETSNNPIGGFFDYSVSSGFGNIRYYPDSTKSSENDFDITYLSYEFKDSLSGIGTTTLGNIAKISTNSVQIGTGITETIASIGKSFSSIKLFIGIDPDIDTNDNALVTLNLTHNQTNLSFIEYGKISTSNVGYGTFYPYLDGDLVKVDFIPGTGIGQTGYINTVQVGLTSDAYTGLSTITLGNSKIEAKTTEISSSGTPGIHTISSYISTEANTNSGSSYFVQVADTTNNFYQSGELIVIDTINSLGINTESFHTEFALIDTSPGNSFIGLGTFGTMVKNNEEVELTFTPNPNIDVTVNVLKHELVASSEILESSANLTLNSNESPVVVINQQTYTGTLNVVKDTFDLSFGEQSIFSREFDGSSADVVNLDQNIINIPGHFFVTGERVDYFANSDPLSAIGIATTSFVGVADTTLLPTSNINELYIIKKNDNQIGFATNAADSMAKIPKYIQFDSLGSGPLKHKIVSQNQNSRVLITLDNFIQSPITLTSVNTTLKSEVTILDNEITFSGISSFLSADFIKINDEIMKIRTVGVGTSANNVSVIRGKVGTSITSHSASSTVTKITGNYLIKDNKISFVEPPTGLTPVETDDPNETDWTGISKGSNFSGRVFMKGPVVGNSTDTYSRNYVFKDISHEFDGVRSVFTLDAERTSYVTELEDDNAIVLLNNIFQSPLSDDGFGNYSITESTPGETKLVFSGDSTVIGDDIGVSPFPKGGVIQSIGSTEGFGYQPLVAAGGTSIISGVGTISSVSVATTGSGYRGSDYYQILSDTNSTIGIGSTEIYVNSKHSILELTELLLNNDGNVIVSIGTYINNASVVSVGNTYIRIGAANTSDKIISIDTQVSVASTGHQIGFINVNAITGLVTSVGVGSTKTDHIGFSTIITGKGTISDVVTITNAGTGYTTSDIPTIEFEDPLSYENIPLVYNASSVVAISTASIYRDRISGDLSNWYLKIEVNKSDLSKIKTGIDLYTASGDLNGQVVSLSPSGAEDAIYILLIGNSYIEPNLINVPSGTEISIGSEFVSGNGRESAVDIVVGNGSSVIDFTLRKTGYSYKAQDSLSLPIGGLTGIPTTSNFNNFKINIQNIHNDTFNAWSVGFLQRLDDLSEYFNGRKREFPLILQGDLISIVPSRSSSIDIAYSLVVFINDIIQTPGESYVFNGGSYIRFNEPLKEGDSLAIFYYKGNVNDSVDVEIIPSVEPGDQLKITSDNIAEVENKRTVSRIYGSRTVITTPYYGPGNIDDSEKYRPVIWSKQMEDKLVSNSIVSKVRTSYEPYIVPTTYLINDVGVGITEFYFDSIRPIFNPQNESNTNNLSFQNEIGIISTEIKSGAAATAVVSGLGTISNIIITDGGSGYTSATVSIASTLGISTIAATATAVVSAAGTVQSISITGPGTGYTSTNPPLVLISIPEMIQTEVCEVHSYHGDEGRIVGFATTNPSDLRFVFDLYMPPNPIFKNTDIVSVSGVTSVTDLSVGDYFVIKNSNIGIATTSIESYSTGSNVIGITTEYIDGVYYVDSVSTKTVEFLGITTTVKRIESRVGNNSILGYDFTVNAGMTTDNGYFGNYSWGKIVVENRTLEVSHPAHTNNGYIGINTSTRVSRSEELKFKNYKT